MAPFRVFFSFVSFDGDFDLPQDGFAGLADGTAQRGYGLGCIEVKDRHEVQVFIPQLRVHPAPGQDGVGGADHCRLMKDKPDVFFIILFQKRTVNDAENVLPMGIPVVAHRPVDDFFNKIW